MLLDIHYDIQADQVHLLKGTFGCFQNSLENTVDFLWRGNTLCGCEKRFSLDGSPYPDRSATLHHHQMEEETGFTCYRCIP